jgi:hypothetical protein
MKKTTLIGVVAGLAAAGIIFLSMIALGLIAYPKSQMGDDISSFDECVQAGYPVMESFPRQCRTSDGRTFVEQISGIRGMVLLGPTCPVVTDPPDPKCADRPYATSLVVTTSDQSTVIKELQSDDTGNFSVEVDPGEYAIRSAAASNVLPYCSSGEVIKVNAGAYTETTVQCDTGIR